ncbi:PAAR-like domain-containing protein [Ectothiorhodospira sp. 9905]|nr:PAAR-like domain-containing protein [Ectothiorhodospira sp. 9905]
MYRSASGASNTEVHFFDDSDTVTILRGGSVSWRTHNPGLLGLGTVALAHEAIGVAHGVPVFPSLEHGRRALRDWLGQAQIRHHSIASLYRHIDPDWQLPSPSLPDRPAHCPDTGLEAGRRVKSLNSHEREAVAQAIERHLGMEAGSVHRQPLETQEDKPTREMAAAGGNIAINGRSAVHAGSQGLLTSIDVCLTRIGKSCKPIPYTNVANSRDATGTAGSVFVNGHPLCHQQSRFARSRGDEAGNCGGVRSRTRRGYAEFVGGSSNVFFEGLPAVRQFDPMVSNCRNTPPTPLMQPGCQQAPELGPAFFDDPPLLEQAHALRLDVDLDRALGRGLEVTAQPRGDLDHPVSAYPRPVDNHRNAHTLLFTGLPGQAVDLVLPLHDLHHGVYHVPLAQDITVQKWDPDKDPTLESGRHVHQLVAVALHRPLDIQGIEHGAIRPGCRVYIFRNGHLWRELEAGPEGSWLEVNLEVWQGKDERPAQCPAGARLLFPHRMDGQVFDYQLALSEPQWNWARIESFGGLAPDDPRTMAPSSEAEATHQARTNAASHPRCLPLNLGREAVRRGRLGRGCQPGGSPRPLLASQPESNEAVELREVNGLITALLPDPLQQARDLRQSMDACLEDLAEAEQSAIDGERALGTLIQRLIEVQPDLQRQVDVPRMNRTLHAWDQRAKDAARRFQALNEDLLSLLQSSHYARALEDYTRSPCTHDRAFGLLQWIHCIRDLDSDTSLPYLRCFLDPQANTLPVLGQEDPETRQSLIDWSTGNQWLETTAPRMKPLLEIDRLQLATFAPDALNRLIDALAEAATAGDTDYGSEVLQKIANISQRVAGIELQVTHIPLSAYLRTDLLKPPKNTYRYHPPGLDEAYEKTRKRVILALMPLNSKTLGDLSQITQSNPIYRGALGSVLGAVMGINLLISLQHMDELFKNEKAITLISLSSNLVALFLTEFQFWADRKNEYVNKTRTTKHHTFAQRGAHTLHKHAKRKEILQALTRTAVRTAATADMYLGAAYIYSGLINNDYKRSMGGALILTGGLLSFLSFTMPKTILLGTLIMSVIGTTLTSSSKLSAIEENIRRSLYGVSRPREDSAQNKEQKARKDTTRILRAAAEPSIKIIAYRIDIPFHKRPQWSGSPLKNKEISNNIESVALIEITIAPGLFSPNQPTLDGKITFHHTGITHSITDMLIHEELNHDRLILIRALIEVNTRHLARGLICNIKFSTEPRNIDLEITKNITWPSKDTRNDLIKQREIDRLRNLGLPAIK